MKRTMVIGTYRCGLRWIENIQKLMGSSDLHEVNCWVPGNQKTHLKEGSLFLIRLNPDGKKMIGGGIFRHSEKNITYSKAWNLYKEANGAGSEEELREMAKNASSYNPDFIASQVITRPFFLDEKDWIDFPERHAQNSLRYLKLKKRINKKIWEDAIKKSDYVNKDRILKDCKKTGLITHRYGQKEFREKILKLFGNKCAVSGERASILIEASHIVQHACDGSYDISNGIPLRVDLHELFDRGYATIRNKDGIYEFLICDRFWKDYDGGENYKVWRKKKIKKPDGWSPTDESLAWHHKKYKKILGDISKL